MKKVYIHGLGQTESSWDNIVNERDINYCPNLKKLLNDKNATFDNLYNEFEKYCNQIEGRLDLCGISLGGMLGLKYAIDNPDKVNSLVLIGTQYKIPKILFKMQGYVFKVIPKSFFENKGFTKKDFILLIKSMENFDIENKLPLVKSKTLVICGQKDKANKKASIELARVIDGAKLVLVEDSRHEVNVDGQKKLYEILNEFYNN